VKRRVVVLLVVGLAGLAGLRGLSILCGWPRTAPRPGVTEGACGAIETGMREEEVAALLGGPAGDYRTGPVTYAACFTPDLLPPESAAGAAWWYGDEVLIGVWFRPNRSVTSTMCVPSVLRR
jgi:hypothetical protein